MHPSSSRVFTYLRGLLLLAALLFSPALTHAQFGDGGFRSGAGIKAGRWEIHPGVAARAGYQANLFNADGEGGQGQAVRSTGMFGVTPHVNITTEGGARRSEGEDRGGAPPALALRSGLSATYFRSFEDFGPRNFAVDSDVWMGLLPERPFNLEVSAGYQRTVRPFTIDTSDSDDMVINNFRGALRLNAENHGGILKAYASYVPILQKFGGDSFSYLDTWTHGTEAGLSWRFLPSTALLYDASVHLRHYRDENDPLAPIEYADTIRLRTRSGMNGALSSRLSVQALVGYAAVLLRDPSSSPLSEVEGVIGDASLTFKMAEWLRIVGAYGRDVLASGLGGAVTTDRVSLALKYQYKRFSSSAEAAYTHLKYAKAINNQGSSLAADGSTERRDHKIDGILHLEYAVLGWLSILADASITRLQTDFEYAVALGNQVFPDPASYTSGSVYGGLRAYY